MPEDHERSRPTRADAIAAYGEQAAMNEIARQSMSPREQAEAAAWSPTSRHAVDELEDLIREERGLPAKQRGGGPGEARRIDGT